jgi:hypothetical protein
MVNAFRAGTIVAVLAAIIGWFMVLRRQSFAGHTLAVVGFLSCLVHTTNKIHKSLLDKQSSWNVFMAVRKDGPNRGRYRPSRRSRGQRQSR